MAVFIGRGGGAEVVGSGVMGAGVETGADAVVVAGGSSVTAGTEVDVEAGGGETGSFWLGAHPAISSEALITNVIKQRQTILIRLLVERALLILHISISRCVDALALSSITD